MPMTRGEWALVVALFITSLALLALTPPLDLSGQRALAQAIATSEALETKIASGALTVTPRWTSTPEPPSAATMTARAPTPVPTPTAAATPYPFDARPDLPRYVYVDQMAQMMYVFEDGAILREIPCSTGLPQSSTFTEAWTGQVGVYWGTFFAFDVYADEAWYLYKSLGSILVHSLPYTLVDGEKVYQDRDALGVRPASHGCIRISPEDAEWFTAWNPEGVDMTVSDPYLEYWRSQQ